VVACVPLRVLELCRQIRPCWSRRPRARSKKKIDTHSGWEYHYEPKRQAEMDYDRKDVIGMSGGRCHGTAREAAEKILGFRREKKDEWTPERYSGTN